MRPDVLAGFDLGLNYFAKVINKRHWQEKIN